MMEYQPSTQKHYPRGNGPDMAEKNTCISPGKQQGNAIPMLCHALQPFSHFVSIRRIAPYSPDPLFY
jgi:hypothetical protein